MHNTLIVGKTGINQGFQLCSVCEKYSNQLDNPTHCPFCHSKISLRKKDSLQKTWALLITALIFIIPANVYPINILLRNNELIPDTIFSGIMSLLDQGLTLIALIVFVASIMVPILKIVGLLIILITVHNKAGLSPKRQLWIFNWINWIGKWSILDLFVISIMVAVFDKGQLLSVYPGIAATSFTIVVVTTLLATKNFDTRLIWDSQAND